MKPFLRLLIVFFIASISVCAQDAVKDKEINRLMKDTAFGHEEAVASAGYNNFSTTTLADGSLAFDDGVLAKSQKFISKLPLNRVLVPFSNTGINIIKYSMDHSFAALANPATVRAIKAGGKEGDIAMAKIVNGSAFVGFATWLASEGFVTPPEPTNYRVKQALDESGKGWQPDSFFINGTYYSFRRVDPAASILRAGAVLSQIRNFVEDDEYNSIATLMTSAAVDYLTPEMMVESTGLIMEAWNELATNKPGRAAERLGVDFASRYQP